MNFQIVFITLGNYTFNGCTSLKNVELPESLISLGTYSFTGCSNLETINIPSKITTIGNNTFQNCSKLSELTGSVFNNITQLGSNSFAGTALVNVEFPNKPVNIGNSTFNGCLNLISYQLPGDGSSGNGVNNCPNLKNIKLQEGATEIFQSAFSAVTTMESFVVPLTVTKIGNGAFNSATSLKYVELHDGIEFIGSLAFYGVPLESFTIPVNDKLNTLPDGFLYGSKIKEIVIPSNITKIPTQAFFNVI